MDKPTIFISYSHKDEAWKDRLRPHLEALALDDRIVVWDDRKIDAGNTWYPEIKDAINRASLCVCDRDSARRAWETAKTMVDEMGYIGGMGKWQP